MTPRRWILLERVLLVIVCIVVLGSLGYATNQAQIAADYRRTAIAEAERRQDILVGELGEIASRLESLAQELEADRREQQAQREDDRRQTMVTREQFREAVRLLLEGVGFEDADPFVERAAPKSFEQSSPRPTPQKTAPSKPSPPSAKPHPAPPPAKPPTPPQAQPPDRRPPPQPPRRPVRPDQSENRSGPAEVAEDPPRRNNKTQPEAASQPGKKTPPGQEKKGDGHPGQGQDRKHKEKKD